MLAYLQLPILSAQEADARRAKGGGTRGCARARSPRIFRSDAENFVTIVAMKGHVPRACAIPPERTTSPFAALSPRTWARNHLSGAFLSSTPRSVHCTARNAADRSSRASRASHGEHVRSLLRAVHPSQKIAEDARLLSWSSSIA